MSEVYWITGASSGIGEALALRLAAQGKRLIISSRNHDALEKVRIKAAENSAEIHILAFDLEKIDQFPSIVEQAWNMYGRIDVLINNGGFSQRGLAMDTAETLERRLMEVNYFAPVALSKAVIPYFKNQGHGHIAVVTSIAGKFGFPLRSSYAAAKHALHGYFEAIRLELMHIPVYITMICPGRVKTNISFNAVQADGSSHGVMDEGQRKGISADRCALTIIKAINKRKYEVLSGGLELIPVYLKRYCPALFYWLIKKIKP
jgi:dehydrogenase/reductase SDR family member 7B